MRQCVADVFSEAGLPEGVLSILPGGAETGRALICQADAGQAHFHRQFRGR